MGEPEAGGLLYRRVAVDNDVGTVQELGPKTYLLFLERGLPSGQYGRGNGRIELVADSRQRPPGSTGPMQPTMAKSADGPAEGGRRSWPGSQSSPRYTKLGLRGGPEPSPFPIVAMVDMLSGLDEDRARLQVFSPSRAGIGSAVSSKSNTSKLAAIRAGFTD